MQFYVSWSDVEVDVDVDFSFNAHGLADICNINTLDDNCRRGSAAVADGCDAVFADFELMEERGEDAGAGGAEGVAEGDGAAEGVDVCVLEAEDLRAFVSRCSRWIEGE